MKRPIALMGLLLLAACASPTERCAAPAAKRLSETQDRINALEVALARGYRVEDPLGLTIEIGGCTGDNVQLCLSKRVRPGERVVPVDAATARAELQVLRAQEARQRQAVVDAVRACEG